MTNCDDITPKLSAYLDGELSEFEQERVRRHLTTCQACADELRALAESAALLGQLGEADPPPSLEPGLRRRIRRHAAALVMLAVLLLITIVPVLVMIGNASHPALPLWARGGYVLSAACLGLAMALLSSYLVQRLRSLVLYGYFSGGQR